MAILAIFSGKITKDMYEGLRKKVDWEHKHPNGGIFHVVGFDDAGHLLVADVWESTEAMNEFLQNRLMPAMQKLNVPPPKVEIYPAHNVNAYSTIGQYKV